MTQLNLQRNDQGYQVNGSLTFANASEIIKKYPALQDLADQAVLDVSQLKSVDSAGLSVLLHWVRAAIKQDKVLKLSGAAGQLAAMIEIADLSDLL